MSINNLPTMVSDGGGSLEFAPRPPKASTVTVTKIEVVEPLQESLPVTNKVVAVDTAATSSPAAIISTTRTISNVDDGSDGRAGLTIEMSPPKELVTIVETPITSNVNINIPKSIMDLNGFGNIMGPPQIAITDDLFDSFLRNTSKAEIVVVPNSDMGSPESLYADDSVRRTDRVTVTVREETPPVVQRTLEPIGVNTDKTAVTEMNIAPRYFMLTGVDNRKIGITKFSFEYLSFLFFETDINQNIPSFYQAIDRIIQDSMFNREEDSLPNNAVIPEEDVIDDELMKIIFTKIWDVAKESTTAIKNLIGFYIYFNRRLRFLPILVQGTSLNEFISDLSVESILSKLIVLGLYPINNKNLFERIWNSYVYSIKEGTNKAEIKMSLREYFNYDINRSMAETYNGFTNKNDKLMIAYDLDLKLWSNERSFSKQSIAFKRFKELAINYISDNSGTKKYLLDLIPSENSIFLRKSIFNNSDNLKTPDKRLWCVMQSFDNTFKINRLFVNKDNIRNMFMEFANHESFPVGESENNNFTELWIWWVEYLNSKASEITQSLLNDDDVNHDYTNIFDKLVWLVNAKFIIQYLENNNAFKNTDYTDGANFINAAILKVYQSISVLKQQLKNIIKYTVAEDRRFYASNA
jgi:hypothetical protein